MMISVEDSSVAIVGAGPVGMTLALLLAKKGHSCTLFESRESVPDSSMAIGVTPPSLAIFNELGLLEQFIESGIPVRQVRVHEDRAQCGLLTFDAIPSSTPYILSIPQSRTIKLLRQAIENEALITLKTGMSFVSLKQDSDSVETVTHHSDGSIQTQQFPWLVGADGVNSRVREQLGLDKTQRAYPFNFFMADLEDTSGWSSEARLYFDESKSIESFPLPEGKRRWVIGSGTRRCENLQAYLLDEISQLLGARVDDKQIVWSSHFAPEYSLVKTYGSGRVFLAGDSAHITTPIGGQGMNVGLEDAYDLASRLSLLIKNLSSSDVELKHYSKHRRAAFHSCSRTGLWGMWLGTRTGKLNSILRGALLRTLLSKRVNPFIAKKFSMTRPKKRASPLSFRSRADLQEKMDDFLSDPDILHQTLSQFALINRLFTRTRKLIKQEVFEKISRGESLVHIVDFGAGGGDLSVWMLGEAKKRGLNVKVTALDQDPRCVKFMESKYANIDGLRILEGEMTHLQEISPIDFLVGNHVLHHLDQKEIGSLLIQASTHTRVGMVFSDLRRSIWAYRLFAFPAACIFRNSFIVEDGLTSIRRGFQKGELGVAANPLRSAWQVNECRGFPFRINLILHKR